MQCSMGLDCEQHAGPAGGSGASHVGKFGVIPTYDQMLPIAPNLPRWRVSHGFACPCLQQAPCHAGVVMHLASAQTGTHLLSAPGVSGVVHLESQLTLGTPFPPLLPPPLHTGGPLGDLQ